MGMSDYIFEALRDMDPCKQEFYSPAPGEEPADFHRRYDEFYRLVTNAMRMLMLYGDQISSNLNDDAFFDRAMQMIRENDQRPWEVLCEELKVELQRPILIPPDDQGRRIDLDSSTASGDGFCPAIPDAESRQIHIPARDESSSDPRDQ
jgi:hypothetical protein